ncbi:hypothetical protein [Desulfococcus multivorans]|uniref:Uncharacterized protein n=1 Tax=Desulfococcus multivorans DSM 2059 TaxID=1121405 RepID=S7T9M5_DESML|nr:hypothetical protein [Desulfococcus multivorans]EPR33321.1 hypothetical protein dsmv_0860 [Desulfococcus multivorans DSM 2059]SKA13673.1 hypothetical protein SAMN02745446_02911 [Desulfococcus multivorans DSM 2059]
MGWIETFKKAGKSVSSKIGEIDIEGRTVSLLMANLNRNLVKNREVFVPQAILENEIAELLKEQDGRIKTTLTSLTCEEEQIKIDLNIKTRLTDNNARVVLRIREFVIGKHRQVAVCQVLNENLVGNNVLGIISAGIIKVTVDDIVEKVISRQEISEIASYSPHTQWVTIDLSKLEMVQKLMKPFGFANISPLDAVCIKAAHKAGGVVISAELAPEFKTIMDSKTILGQK